MVGGVLAEVVFLAGLRQNFFFEKASAEPTLIRHIGNEPNVQAVFFAEVHFEFDQCIDKLQDIGWLGRQAHRNIPPAMALLNFTTAKVDLDPPPQSNAPESSAEEITDLVPRCRCFHDQPGAIEG
jgi:hypothetical protein